MKQAILFCTTVLLLVSAGARNRKVKIVTSRRTIIVALSNKTPKHRDNFVKLVKQHFYDSIIFHRVIKDFMIQAGDPDTKKLNPVSVMAVVA
jgi:peptidyl-prolyl cis-trans isomerase B (cyclophilin B)